TPTNEELERLIRPGEVKSTGARRANVLENARGLLKNQELSHLVSAARAGEALKDWYPAMRATLEHVMGQDARRFMKVLAATSPQQNVENNLRMSLKVWHDWVDAGRPTDIGDLKKMFRYTGSGKKVRSVELDARRNNTITALSAADENEPLSGPKVNPFDQNLSGDRMPVTNDRIQAQVHNWKQQVFDSPYGNVAGTPAVRRVAEELGWHPDQAQAAEWGFWRTLMARVGDYGDPYQELLRITNEHIIDAGDLRIFNRLIDTDPEIRSELQRHGLNVDNLPVASAPEGVEPGRRIIENEGTDP